MAKLNNLAIFMYKNKIIFVGRKKGYLNNGDLLTEIKKSKEQDELTPKALKMLMLLAEKANRKLHYNNPNDKKDCIATAYIDLWKYWRNFDPSKSTNAFAYFTSIAKRGYAKGWNKIHPKKYEGTVSIYGSSSGKDDADGIYSLGG